MSVKSRGSSFHKTAVRSNKVSRTGHEFLEISYEKWYKNVLDKSHKCLEIS